VLRGKKRPYGHFVPRNDDVNYNLNTTRHCGRACPELDSESRNPIRVPTFIREFQVKAEMTVECNVNVADYLIFKTTSTPIHLRLLGELAA